MARCSQAFPGSHDYIQLAASRPVLAGNLSRLQLGLWWSFLVVGVGRSVPAPQHHIPSLSRRSSLSSQTVLNRLSVDRLGAALLNPLSSRHYG